MCGVIYLITNNLNGKQYVGKTTRSLNIRMNHHKCGGDLHIDRAIRKYGRENFTVEVLEECYTVEQLNEREIFWIAALNCKHPNGYNHTDGGEGTAGLKHTYEQYVGRAANFRGNSPYPNLIAEIKRRELTYTALAKFFGITQPTLSRKIKSEYNFTDKDRAKLKEIFQKPIKYLLRRDDC